MKLLNYGITFHFTGTFLPTKRHRKERKHELVTCREIPVRNIMLSEADEFPVAFIVHDKKSVYPSMKSYEDYYKLEEEGKGEFRDFPMEIRLYDGKLYEPLYVTHGAAISDVPVKFDELRDILDRTADNANEHYYHNAWNEYKNGVSIDTGDNLDEIVNAMQEVADEYIVFGSNLWKACGEPMYVINTFGLGHNHGGTSCSITQRFNSNISAKNYFNALQHDEAIAYGKAVALGRGDTDYVDMMGYGDYIDVVIPEAVKCEPNKDHANGGDLFMEKMEGLINSSDNAMEAGMLCILNTMAEIAS